MIKATSQGEIKQVWHLIDAQDQILGRLVTKIAALLMGKNKPYFVRYLDCGDYVVVINAKQIKVTGQKEKQKLYYRYSGYPGGLRNRSLGEMRQVMPEKIIYEAVKGMLPQNKLRDRMLTRLYVYPESEYPYKDKFKI